MTTIHPAVQAHITRASRYVCISRRVIRDEKRLANRRYRRYLNLVTKSFVKDPDLFDEEEFGAPSLSLRDLV